MNSEFGEKVFQLGKMINLTLNLVHAGKLVDTEEIVICLLEYETYAQLLLKIHAVLPARFHWDELEEPIRYQRNRSQTNCDLEVVGPISDFYDMFVQTQIRNMNNESPVVLWIFGTLKSLPCQNALHALACLSAGSPSMAHKSPESPLLSNDDDTASGDLDPRAHCYRKAGSFPAYQGGLAETNFNSGCRRGVSAPASINTEFKEFNSGPSARIPLGNSPTKDLHEKRYLKRKFDSITGRPIERSKGAKHPRVKMLAVDGVEYVILVVKLNGVPVELPIEFESLKSVLEYTKLRDKSS